MNVAICKYKMGEYASTANVAAQVIEMDQKYVKGHFWLAKGLFTGKNYELALKAISEAARIEPENGEVREEYERIKEGYRKFKEGEQKKYSKMFK